jgi:hypothetical protein
MLKEKQKPTARPGVSIKLLPDEYTKFKEFAESCTKPNGTPQTIPGLLKTLLYVVVNGQPIDERNGLNNYEFREKK